MRLKKWDALKEALKSELQQGMSKSKIALAIVVGVTVGLFPVIGTTTFLSALITHFSKLNHVIVQGVNYLVYPLQLLLWYPLILLGSKMTGVSLDHWNGETLKNDIMNEPIAALTTSAWTQIYGVVAWSVLVVPLAVVLYGITRFILKDKVGAYVGK